MNTKYWILALLLVACQASREELKKENAVYYWRTELRLDSAERAFLKRYHISKVYCRYFDVVMTDEGPMPNATLTFSDMLPKGMELVPTVYITEDCMHQRHEGMAKLLVKRIAQMNETNDVSGVKEIQIDCDYTSRSRQTYYDFLKEVAQAWSSLHQPSNFNTPPKISATIRLHQLAMTPPPVDYGVLMLYNTGNPQKFTERNPVLDMRDVQPYLRYLSGYELPMGAAYPVFLWKRNIHGVHIEHGVEAQEICRVKQAVEQKRPELSNLILTYHLDKENIERYQPDDYEEIYHH